MNKISKGGVSEWADNLLKIKELVNDKILDLKGYFCYKIIFCQEVALDGQLMNFFIWRKNSVLFSRFLDF